MDAEEKKKAIAQAAARLAIVPAEDVTEDEAKSYTKIPWANVAAMGAAFASMSDAFRTITIETAFDASGLYKPHSVGASGWLAQAKDGSGYLGTIVNENGIAGQARWREAESLTSSTSVTMPIDPYTLAMMAMLVQIDVKLNDILAMQEEMFEYLKVRDRSKVKGDLNLMVDVLNAFRNNWDNESYRRDEIPRLKEIQRTAEQYLVQCQDLIDGKNSRRKPLLHFSVAAGEESDELCELLGDYQLALNSYTFSTFLLVLLEENYEAKHLETVLSSLEKRSNSYRLKYTECFNRIEKMADASIDSGVLGGLAAASKALGSVVEKTPLGSVSPIDGFLQDASDAISRFGEGQKFSIIGKILSKRDGGVRPFSESIREIKRIYNEPIDFLIDGDGVYFKQLGD